MWENKNRFKRGCVKIKLHFVELGKTMDMEVKDYFFYKFKIYGEFTTSAILAPFEWGEYESKQWQDMSEASSSLGQKIRGSLKQSYEFIPDEMSIFNNVSSSTFKPSLVAEDYIQRTNPPATT